MGKGHPTGSQSLVRITTEGRTILEKLRARFAKVRGKPVSFAEAMQMALKVAERMTNAGYQQRIADELAKHTRKNAVNIVRQLLGEKPTVTMHDNGSCSLKIKGRPPVVVAENQLDLSAALAKETGQPQEYMRGH